MFVRKVHFLEIPETLEILEILEKPQTVEKRGDSDHFLDILEIFMVDVSDIFFWSGRGKRESEAQGGGGGRGWVFLLKSQRGGGFPGGGGAEGPGRVSAANW